MFSIANLISPSSGLESRTRFFEAFLEASNSTYCKMDYNLFKLEKLENLDYFCYLQNSTLFAKYFCKNIFVTACLVNL